MDDDITKKVQERYTELPADIRQAVESADLDAHIQTIGNKHRLHLDQMEALQDETLLVMLGFNDPSSFVNKLVAGLGLSQTQAEGVATDINNEVFAPIRESLKKFHAQPASVPANTAQPVKQPMPQTSSAPQNTPTPSSPQKPQTALAPHPNDLTLATKTVTTPPTAAPIPPKPQNYKTDPYREPVGP